MPVAARSACTSASLPGGCERADDNFVIEEATSISRRIPFGNVAGGIVNGPVVDPVGRVEESDG